MCSRRLEAERNKARGESGSVVSGALESITCQINDLRVELSKNKGQFGVLLGRVAGLLTLSCLVDDAEDSAQTKVRIAFGLTLRI